MKTQRRHEMQTNVLADWLGHQIEQLRPYGKLLGIAAVAVAVLVAAGMFFRNDQAARLSAAWSDFFAASHEANPERLRAVAADHSGTIAGLLARLTEADLQLAQGMRLLYVDRDAAKTALGDARQSYEEVITGSANDQLRNAARYGLAQSLECLGRLDEAVDAYGEVAESSTALFSEAQERIAALQDSHVRKFYDWFSEQKPLPRGLSNSLPGGSPMTPGIPSNLDLLSDQPDFSFPPGILGGAPLGTTPAIPPTGSDTIDEQSSPILPLQLDTDPPAASDERGAGSETAAPPESAAPEGGQQD